MYAYILFSILYYVFIYPPSYTSFNFTTHLQSYSCNMYVCRSVVLYFLVPRLCRRQECVVIHTICVATACHHAQYFFVNAHLRRARVPVALPERSVLSQPENSVSSCIYTYNLTMWTNIILRHHIAHSRLRFLSLSVVVFPSTLVCLFRLSVPDCFRLVVLSKYESIIRPINPVRPGKSTKNRCRGCDGSNCGTWEQETRPHVHKTHMPYYS